MLLSQEGIEIGDNCFENCSKLSKITIPPTVTKIGEKAFFGCSSLIKIEIPSSVKSIGDQAFFECSSLTDLFIPASVTSAGSCIISLCHKLKHIKVPASILSHSIDEYQNFINKDEYDVEELSNESSMNKIYKMTNKKTGEKLVAKKYPTSLFECSKSNFIERCNFFNSKIRGLLPVLSQRYSIFDKEEMNKELDKIEVIDENGNTIFLDYPSFTVITKYIENENLEILTDEYLDSEGKINDKMNPTIRSKIIFFIAEMIRKIHNNRFILCCLTINNVLLNENFEPQLAFHPKYPRDDVLLKKYNESSKDAFLYIENGCRSYNSDIYAFGSFLYRMFSNTFKFDSYSLPYYDRPIRPDNIPDQYWELIQECWESRFRPSFQSIVNLFIYDEQFALEEFGMETDLQAFDEYKKEIIDLPECDGQLLFA